MSKSKAIAVALGVVLVVLAVLPFRTPIRKYWRHRNARHTVCAHITNTATLAANHTASARPGVR